MTEEELKKTKHKLTLHFVGVVFLMAFFLEVVFLSLRFYHEALRDESIFKGKTENIIQSLEKEKDLLNFFRLWLYSKIDKDYIEKRRKTANPSENLISYFVVNKRGEIVEESIKEAIDFTIFLENHSTWIYKYKEALIRKEYITWFDEDVTIYLYKKHNYSLRSYFIDIINFFLLTSLLSFLFYFIGYRFVYKVFKPVEENIEDMTNFIHNAGHELKTPLAVIRGNLQVMHAEKKMDPLLLEKSLWEVDHISKLIDSLRELSDLGKVTKKREVNIKEIIDQIISDLSKKSQEKNIYITNSIKSNYIIYASAQELSVLFWNILQNAVKYNVKNGEIKVYRRKNIIYISDTGVGISQRDQEKIFDRFYQTSQARSGEWFGIGLSLVKKIIDINNWKIEIQSKKWEGTTFKIIF